MTFKRSSILTGFQECKLISYNPVIVFEKFKKYQLSSSPFLSSSLNRSNTPSKAQIWPPITFLTVRSLEKHVIYLQNATSSR